MKCLSRLLCLASALPLFGQGFSEVNHFDSPEDIARFLPRLKTPEKYFDTVRKAAGKGAVTGHRFQKNFSPADQKNGCVITFYFYDDEFEKMRTSALPLINILLQKQKNGKMETVLHELRRWPALWRIHARTGNPGEQQYFGVFEPNQNGWTRFDIVNSGPAGDGKIIFYMNGHEIFRTKEAYQAVTHVDTSIYHSFDEYSFYSDPKKFRPNPVARIMPDRAFDTILLKHGERLSAELELNAAGASASSGKMELVLLDGRGRDTVSVSDRIDWKRMKDRKFRMTLPQIPRSGYYWLESRYTETGRYPEVTRRKVNIQFYDSATIRKRRPHGLTARRSARRSGKGNCRSCSSAPDLFPGANTGWTARCPPPERR